MLAAAASLGAVSALGATSACSRVSSADAGDGGELLERLKAQGTVKLGLAGEQPYSYIDKDGELTGSSPAIARIIFKRLGIPNVQPFPTEFNSLIPGLNSQQFDVVAAGMYITPDRCKQVVFADPEYEMRDAFIVRKGNPKNLRTYADIKKAGAKMATGTGYAEIAYAEEEGVKESEMLLLPDQLAGLLAVEQGRADVFAGTAVTVRNVVKQTKSRKAEFTEAFTPKLEGKPDLGTGAFAFRQSETHLREVFNRELRKMKKSGELFRVMKPFGFLPEEMTTMTAKERCK
ncbi:MULTISPECIES: ectoine/hydroxyectoine ABC transporter substrate-binding protein EhuB [unclassified Streptomyces]|uniref:ectoine/hydroxyectoine ABC transporter substrate-binding protein EhuB n=1 Tax=unclassified Streptomyces TaxID=2593676 RepID=UPI002DDBBDCF|nr:MULTISPECIES: ectoine/hydroxyectoine ABC transporter substrate-binding protein EhuB [unclassified Streptomyces]WSA94529.1 ectoine/hydroxyectoine ABC transporter substrate-binding protein EhuB [Streptomyces sp. NBC_01795]WSB78949.1 ectoine/hydroxyectoine ABC transporter substrate-binding protein EhuB [Streptomyces sp. NBC_01775]WSS12849.1 ectoine/hydroxyectoine ABC transporter substrate-binding protein EhuB [Streptomyces sp. NBC_01186]WSS41633.1 ectoine/hydroxyectoine ABC transporter substrat